MGDGRGKGYGTGSPITFKCLGCLGDRKVPGARIGHIGDVRLTGRTRAKNGTRKRYARHGAVMREYICMRCGWQGWSSHYDLERLERLEKGRSTR